jgi:hypothetical protein
MARGKSEKLLTALPADYSADWLERADKRTKVWRVATEREAALISDAGGAETLSHSKRSLIRRAVFLELLAETQEMRFTAGEPLDIGAYTQAFNSMLGAYRLLGLDRRTKPAESLHALMYGESAEIPHFDGSAPSPPQPAPEANSEATYADQSPLDAEASPDENAAHTSSGEADAP